VKGFLRKAKSAKAFEPDLEALAAALGKAKDMESISAAMEKHAPGMSLRKLQVLFKLHGSRSPEREDADPKDEPKTTPRRPEDEAITLPSSSLK
jgi:hypothetical protein